jgi:hypothetical protein
MLSRSDMNVHGISNDLCLPKGYQIRMILLNGSGGGARFLVGVGPESLSDQIEIRLMACQHEASDTNELRAH